MTHVNFGNELVEPAEKTRRVRSVFERVASRYDLMNDLMSGGLHRLWKSEFVRAVRPRAGEHFLDVAGGTGDVAFRLAARGAHVTVADVNPAMLEQGMRRREAQGNRRLFWAQENAEALSFEDGRFDGYTIAFGIRNVTDVSAALREARRVLRYGGRFYCLEFSTCEWPGAAELYARYSDMVIPRIGGMVAGDEAAYRYLVESIRRFPPMAEFAAMLRDAGFSQVQARPILGGVVAIHSGWKA